MRRGARVEIGVVCAAALSRVELSHTQGYQRPALWGLNVTQAHWNIHRTNRIHDCTLGEGFWQVRKAKIAEMGGKKMNRMGAKGLEWQAGGKRRGRHPKKTLVRRDIRLKRRERSWFTEGSVRWERWYTDATWLCHRLGRERFLVPCVRYIFSSKIP
jgi:hypothetical protein